MYLKSFEIDSIGTISPYFIFTQDGKREKVFQKNEPVEKYLIRTLKLEREAIKDDYFYLKSYAILD